MSLNAETKTSLTEVKRELEFRRSKTEDQYFFSTFWYIPVPGHGPVIFKPRDFQQETLAALKEHTLIVGLKARQIGMSTIAAAHAFHDAFFNDNHSWLLVSIGQDQAKKLLARITYGYDRLPKWLKDRNPLVSRTQQSLVFANGSVIEAIPSNASTGRGDSVWGAILDEYAHMDYASEVYAAIEPLVYGKMIVISTANGMGNRFYEFWIDSQMSDSAWFPLFFPWSVVPSRNEAWLDRERLKHRGQEWFFYQEYPSTAEEAFAKSGRVAFSQEVLAYLPWEAPTEFIWTGEGFMEAVELSPDNLRVWELPTIEVDEDAPDVALRKPNYVIGVDVAMGLEHGDFTAISVWDVNNEVMVASMYANFPVEDLDRLLYDLGEWYFWALIVVERNAAGIAPLTGLLRERYPRLYRQPRFAAVRRTRAMEFGWTTGPQNKAKMVHEFLAALRAERPILMDETFKREAQVFVADGKGGFSATESRHDDFIMATLIGWQGVLDSPRFPPIWVDRTPRPLTFDDVLNIHETTFPGNALDMGIGSGSFQTVVPGFFIHPVNVKQGERV